MRRQPGGDGVTATAGAGHGSAILRPRGVGVPVVTGHQPAAACVADAVLRALDARGVAVARVDVRSPSC